MAPRPNVVKDLIPFGAWGIKSSLRYMEFDMEIICGLDQQGLVAVHKPHDLVCEWSRIVVVLNCAWGWFAQQDVGHASQIRDFSH